MRYLLVLALVIQISCSSTHQQDTAENPESKPQREMFQKSSIVIKSPVKDTYKDSENEEEYDPKPKVVEIDKEKGKYEFRWIGGDGKEKVVKYQRADAIDAVVEARVEKKSENRFVYKYLIKNLPSSPTYFSSFTVQTLTDNIEIIESTDLHIGEMTSSIWGDKEGTWWRFAPLNEIKPKIEAGMEREFSLTSSALPGIVSCRATAGELTLKGVGEEMPWNLANVLPGYEEWAKSYTIGPVDKLSKLNNAERVNYILENLPKFVESGWITKEGEKRYELILKSGDLKGVLTEAKKDFEKGYITSEVLHIIDGLN